MESPIDMKHALWMMNIHAKRYVKAALEAANKYKAMNINGGKVGYLEIEYKDHKDGKKKTITINEDSILNACPEENIK